MTHEKINKNIFDVTSHLLSQTSITKDESLHKTGSMKTLKTNRNFISSALDNIVLD